MGIAESNFMLEKQSLSDVVKTEEGSVFCFE